MRKVTYGAACSLDGFIASQDGSIDWLHFSKDVQEIMKKYLTGVDTFLMGRKTWADAVERSGGSGAGGAASSSVMTTYVFSRTLKEIKAPGVQLVSEKAGDFVRDLKSQKGKGEICVMGGGLLGQSLFEAGVIDEVGLNIHPVLLGAGVPLFRDAGRRVKLALTECRTIDGGCVLANYRVLS
ncbi:MAG: dihydrofolate reductase family protein [Gemmatimonadaceae bacterium]